MKEVFLKKESGNIGYGIFAAIFILTVLFFTSYQFTKTKMVSLKESVDNGVILSALSADVMDIYQYATYNDVAYAVEDDYKVSKGYMNDITTANQKAGKLALKRFLRSLQSNVNADWNVDKLELQTGRNLPVKNNGLFKSVSIDSFILYNKIGDKIYKCSKQDDGTFNVETLQGNTDPANAHLKSSIETSSLYVKMTFCTYVIDEYTTDIPIEEYVDICVE